MVDPTKFSATPLSSSPVPSSPVRKLSPAPDTATKSQGAPQPSKSSAAQPQKTSSPVQRPLAARKSINFSTTPFWLGLAFSMLWIAVVALALIQAGASHTFGGLPLVNWAIGISAIVSPVGMIWMVTAYLQRAADVQSVAEPLRRQLSMITGESGAAEIRIKRFNQAVREQLELLRSTQSINQNDLVAIMDRVRQHKNELEQFEQHSIYQVKEIQEVIRRSMQHIEQLMDDKFTMLRALDNKFIQSGDDISRQTEQVQAQLGNLLEDIESNTRMVGVSLEQAMRDSKILADTARSQETSLISAAESASTTLQDLSGKIDINIAHFLERAGSAREEAERLASALDTQTRSLDEFSNTLPARVSEAESVLRGVADRLYASEQLASEQAIQLSEKLSKQVDGLQEFLDRFGVRLHDIDGNLQQRRSDLDGLVVRISGATEDMAQQLEGSITSLDRRAKDSLRQFVEVNEEARRGADSIAEHLAETTATYESATKQLNEAAEGNSSQWRAITYEIGNQLTQFDALNEASLKAGQDVQSRASTALQNMQSVLERLLATRDATQSVGENLAEKLLAAVDQNERVIMRINEAAQMTVHALGIATDSLGRQEDSISVQGQVAEATLRETIAQLQDQARFTEKAMREQNAVLISLMKETQDKLDDADRKLQNFASLAAIPVQQVVQQIENSTAQGMESVGRYSDNMHEQLSKLQQFSVRVGGMGEEIGRMTVETLGSIENLNNRFLTVRAAQEETARGTLEQFSSVADRLQREVGSLDEQTSKAVNLLQTAATQVGQHSQQLQREAEDSGAKIQIVTTALQNEAAQIRSVLQKQADDLNTDLSRAERQFAIIGESLKQRTDTAYSLLDRMATHYNDMTRSATDEFEVRANRLEQTATAANSKVEELSSNMAQQLNLIGNGTSQLEASAALLTSTNGKTLQQMSALNEKLSLTQEATTTGAQQVAARLEETNSAFMRQHNSLNDAAQNAVILIQKAGTAFGEQASKMLDTTHQVEQNVRSLNAATSAFAEQSTQIRTSMEQHNTRLITSLTESVSQLDVNSAKLQQATATATLGADQASTRFNEMTQNASMRIKSTTQDLMEIAGKTENTLSSLNSSITQQVSSLNLVSEQLSEQHKTLTVANENHRTQLVDLFEKLGMAHGQASEVAERTIARLSDALQQIQRQLGVLGDQSQVSLVNVRNASTGFADQSGMLLQHAQQAEQQARTVLSVTSALQDQAKQLREALHAEGERTGDLLGSLLGKLSSGNSELRDLGSTAEVTLTSLQQHINHQTTELNGSMQQISDRQRSLTTALDAQRDVLNGLLNRLALAQDETASMAERSATRITDGTQQITRQMEAIDSQAQNTLISVRTASTGFVDEIGALSQHTIQAEQQAKSMFSNASALQDQARQLREAMHGESEKTGEVLGTLLFKINAGTAELRDIGSSTETTLDGLQKSVVEHTTALNNSMQQISERQRALSTSLESQRETLNGLLSRLSLAQDETASMSERSVTRLSDGVQLIAKQMEVIDTQAQTTLASVKVAGAGFINEAGTLNMHAQQTEQQARGMLSVTAGMQDQARQLRESMQNESARVIEHLNSVISQLDITSQQLKLQTNTAINTMDKSVMDFSALSKSTSDSLNKQSETLADVTEKAEERVTAASDKIRTHIKIVSEAGDKAEQQAQQLANTAEHATTRLVTLRDGLSDGDKDARNLLNQAEARIVEIRETLQRELQQVAQISQTAVQQVTVAGQELAEHSDELRRNLASSESALNEAATLVRDETIQLPVVLERSAAQIEATNKTFKEQTAEISGTMVSTADRFINVTGAVRDTMMEEMRHLSSVADTADSTLRQFNQALVDQIGSIKKNTTQLSDEQVNLIEKSNEAVTQLSAASDRLSQLRSKAMQTTEKLALEFEAIENKATSTTQRLVLAGENVNKQVEQLSQTTERAEGQMLSASQNFREQLERIRSGVQLQIDDINRGLMQITAQLERTGTTLRSATVGTVADIEKISTRFDQTSKDAVHQLTDRTARMRVATEEVAKLLGGFGDQIDQLLTRLSVAGDGLKKNESDVIGQLQSALTHLSSIAERLESNRLLTADVSDEAVARLAEVAHAVEKQMNSLKEGSHTVTGIVRGVGQMYTEQTQGMNKSVVEAQSQVLVMNKSIEEMQQRTDRMRVSLKLQSDDLMGSLEQILSQLSMTGDTMSDTVDQVLQRQAEDSLKKIS